jgi:malonate transporter
MNIVLEVVAPVFVIVALGWAAARFRYIDAAGFKGLNTFTFTLGAPALLFLGGTTAQGGGGPAALAFFCGTAVLYAAALLAGRWLLGMALSPAGLFALNASFGNTVMMGIPLVVAGFGVQAMPVMLAILALHSMVLLGVATVVAEIGLNARAPLHRVLWATARGVARNPIVMSVLVALVWRNIGLPPPTGLLRHTLDLLGAAAPPVALFCLGGSLLGFNARAAWRETAVVLALKLLVMPLLVWGACRLLAVPPAQAAVAVLVAALPTGANAFLLAQRYQVAAEQSGAAVLLGTLLSVVTLSALLVWLG